MSGYAAAAGGIMGSLISGLFNLGSTQVTNETNKSIQDSINATNLDLARYQYEKNLEQWRRENKYNSPLEQMRRYQEAGLNPNLIYGQQNLSASSPQYQAPEFRGVHLNAPQLPDFGAAFTNAVALYQDIKYKHAQIDNLEALSELNRQREQNEILRGLLNEQKYGFNKEYFPLQIAGLGYDVDYKGKTLPYRVLNSQYQADKTRAQIQYTQRQTQLAIARARLTQALTLQSQADTKLKNLNYDWFSQRNRFGYEQMMNYQYNKALGVGIGAMSDQISKGMHRNIFTPIKNGWNYFKNSVKNIKYRPQKYSSMFGG